jgi:hypothetical protein
MELTRRQDGSKNSWISEAGESTEQDLEMEGGKTLLVTQTGKESFWLRLLMMMASIFPVYTTSKSRWKWTHIGWTVYPALFVLSTLVLLVENITDISQYSKFKVSHQNETIGNQTEEYTVEIKIQWAATLWLILFCIQAATLSLSRKSFVNSIPQELLGWFGKMAIRMCLISVLFGLIGGLGLFAVSAYIDSNLTSPGFFFFTVIAFIWQGALVCTLSMRAYVYTKVHSVHYKALWAHAKSSDQPQQIKNAMALAKGKLDEFIKSSLQTPLVSTIVLHGVHMIVGMYIAYRSKGVASFEKLSIVFIFFTLLELFNLAEPVRALTVVGDRAKDLITILCNNKRLPPADTAGLVELFPHIFPYVRLYDIPVTTGRLAGLVATPLLAVAGSVLGPFFQSL